MPSVGVDGGELYYEERGSGPAVVLVHGGGGDLSHWRHQVEPLARAHRVVAYDFRGHGRSTGAGVYDITTCAEDLAALLRQLGIGRAHIIGATLGGVVGLEFALAHPEMAGALVVISTAPDVTEEMRARFAASVEIVRAGDLAAFAEGFVNFIFSPAYVGAHAEEVDDFRERLARIDPVGYAAALSALGERPDLGPRLGGVRSPVLVVTGELDPIPTSAPGAEVLMQRLPDARRLVIGGAAHLPQIEQPEVFNRAVLEFLAGAGTGG